MIATMAMTVITPMTMPRVVRKERSRCVASEPRAMRSPSATSAASRRRRLMASLAGHRAGAAPSRAPRPGRLQGGDLGAGAVAQRPAVHELDGLRAARGEARLVGHQD